MWCGRCCCCCCFNLPPTVVTAAGGKGYKSSAYRRTEARRRLLLLLLLLQAPLVVRLLSQMLYISVEHLSACPPPQLGPPETRPEALKGMSRAISTEMSSYGMDDQWHEPGPAWP